MYGNDGVDNPVWIPAFAGMTGFVWIPRCAGKDSWNLTRAARRGGNDRRLKPV
ncbi:hypothetical protein OMAG_001312 [Candidatus Omnitrophus magneticus]|uniref:Uncharacterized protein n=1 Tax=Candidatus Omnitrophus magneticus TaxID=1609969 RepID=A0A0F0CTG2_9BACT|nr:hypothetical protein OMAG_001312 [Candidatus Omnitrophus magneticus]